MQHHDDSAVRGLSAGCWPAAPSPPGQGDAPGKIAAIVLARWKTNEEYAPEKHRQAAIDILVVAAGQYGRAGCFSRHMSRTTKVRGEHQLKAWTAAPADESKDRLCPLGYKRSHGHRGPDRGWSRSSRGQCGITVLSTADLGTFLPSRWSDNLLFCPPHRMRSTISHERERTRDARTTSGIAGRSLTRVFWTSLHRRPFNPAVSSRH